jgi:hypothetical protein
MSFGRSSKGGSQRSLSCSSTTSGTAILLHYASFLLYLAPLSALSNAGEKYQPSRRERLFSFHLSVFENSARRKMARQQ